MQTSTLLSLLLLLSVTMVGCGKRTADQASSPIGHDNARSEDAALVSGAPQRPPLKFRTETCIDRTGTGTEAFRMLVPEGWAFSGGITWKLDNPGMPATAWFRATNASANEELELSPNQSFFWRANTSTSRWAPQ